MKLTVNSYQSGEPYEQGYGKSDYGYLNLEPRNFS